jgi:aerobic-type carbon monoxide dehydrogenase small subunit (CoxS/CutS family)
VTKIQLVVNGGRFSANVDDGALLLDVLREHVGLTSVREGCGVGACGACTVLVDGHSVSSCMALAVRYSGANITTVDGLAADDEVVESFVDSGAMQCGYCIPGFVLMSRELLTENPKPSRADVDDHLAGNICRCGVYQEICEAVLVAADRWRTQ